MSPPEGAAVPARVYVSVGSNVEPERHLRAALRELRRQFGSMAHSSVFRTAAVGFDGDQFLNMVVSFETRSTPTEVLAVLDTIENAAGRERHADRFAPRTLDLDILLYGDLVCDEPGLRLPRSDILRYAFVLGPLAELSPDLVHPVTGLTMRELWASFDAREQSIHRLAKSPL